MNNEFGLYIHWPFCIKKCPYCDFNSYALKHETETFINAITQELEQAEVLFRGYKLKTIFFGGGTPSLIPPQFIKLIIDKALCLWPRYEKTNKLEITLETNPSSIESHALEKFMENGINRFSIGIQSLNDDNLKFLGRLHSANEAVEIITQAAKICDNTSGDFMYSLPSDTITTWKKDLTKILELADKINLKHCSLYQLTIENDTAFEQAVRTNEWKPMDEDKQSVLYKHTYETLNNGHWDFYEISNAARNNVSRETISEYRSRHNLIYWNYEPYLGIGAGAHSRVIMQGKRVKFNNVKSPYKWLENIQNTKDFFEHKVDIEILSAQIEFQEKTLMGLRLTDGIKINDAEMQFIDQDKLEMLIKHKFITQNGSIYSLPIKGRLKLNSILQLILKNDEVSQAQ